MFPWCMPIFTCAFVVLVGVVINRITDRLRASAKRVLPPVYSGWLPWLGCALEFGRSPLTFIEVKRRELGPVFTLVVAGERMTFLTQPTDFRVFFQSPNVDFQKAVQKAVQNVASVTEDAFFRNHTKIHDTVKGCLAAGNLPGIIESLHEEFLKHLLEIRKKNESNTATKIDLMQVVQTSMYKSVMTNLFGKGVLPTDDEETFKELHKNFVTFDDQFEYGARMPHIFFKDFSMSKKWLLALFTKVAAKILRDVPQESTSKNLLQTLLSVVDREFAPNWSLLLLWASLANAIPITFWTLALIYNHPQVLAKVRAEMATVLKAGDIISEATTIAQLPYVKQCAMEAIRLSSPGVITRRVTEDVTVQGYTIPAGDMLMVSPYWAHRNPNYFPEPDEFRPDRWNRIEKNSLPEEFIAFGGGRYQCPGRWFAQKEIHLYVSMFVSMFDCKLLNGVPDRCTIHVVGTQQPVQKCLVLLSNCSTL